MGQQVKDPAEQRDGLLQALRALVAAADEPALDLTADAAALASP